MFSELKIMSDSPLLDTGVRQKGLNIIKPIVYGNLNLQFTDQLLIECLRRKC